MNLTISILELLRSNNSRKITKTATQIANKLEKDPNKINAICQQLVHKHLLHREQRFNPSSGKTPWYYIITPKGKKYLSLKKQLKALLNHE